MRKLLSARKGFTLIEMIITVALLAIISGMAVSVITPMTQVVRSSNELAEISRIYDTVSGEMLADMERATGEFTISGASVTFPVPGGTVGYSVSEAGVIMRQLDGGEPQPLLDAKYYRRWRAGFSLTGENGVYELTLTLTGSDDRTAESRSYVIRPLVLRQS